ncbi:hypothetical protein [Burkholderia savannae]|uniref:hypothetical protein n=1 Tax=Burkholderia savannae TaxID=1637837 RepID=UPI0012F4AAF6|nr:hypothetical protein [Burkholderia savannae]
MDHFEMARREKAGRGQHDLVHLANRLSHHLRQSMNPHIKTALVVLGTVAVCAFIQKSVFQIPVVGPYLPGGANA